MAKRKVAMRGLSRKFINDLKEENGLLHSLLERIREDSTLCLEIRKNYINVYYRGGSIMKVERKINYEIEFDNHYLKGNKYKIETNLPPVLCTQNDISEWIIAIPSLKQVMDCWFNRHPKEEREFQQIVSRENNSYAIGSSTDYFIIDIEYDNHKGARFDLVAVEWESHGTIRKLQRGYEPKLSLIEMKYGDGAISGKAGMLEHIEDFTKYCALDRGFAMLKEEMVAIFKQKRELGLIPSLINNRNVVEKFSNEVDFIFLLVNHDPESSKLVDILGKINKKYVTQKLGFNLKFCSSNFMGYGIYKQNIYSFPTFIARFDQQISCNL